MGKMPNKIAYEFFSRKLLDLFITFPLPNTYIARTDIIDAISFALANQKTYYNRKH